MDLQALNLKFKFGGSLFGRESSRANDQATKRPSWMTHVTHGYHAIEYETLENGSDSKPKHSECDDSYVVQREQMEDNELWFFGIFDPQIGNGITKYLRSHFFEKKLDKSEIRRKCEKATKKAYLEAKAKMCLKQGSDDVKYAGSASAMVINGHKLVLANMGKYKAVVCRDGVAHPIDGRHQKPAKKQGASIFISSVQLAWESVGGSRKPKSTETVVAERIDSSTEFVILASDGIWEVMTYQEAVSLISHIEDPQEAAEYLTYEASARMRECNTFCTTAISHISCFVIRFD